MSDLISRQDIKYHVQLEAMGNGQYEEVEIAYKSDIESLPSAEAPTVSEKHQLSEETPTYTSTDLIRRQDAIDAVRKVWCDNDDRKDFKQRLYEMGNNDAVEDTIGYIESLPSADAVQIPIKLEKRYPQSRDEDITDAFMRGYLAGRSSAYRPTGHIVTKCSGKFNPTVWAECSECEKPIDAWDKFCRHCGARMLGEDGEE